MERPDLNYNYYYPFYTQSCTGEKKYSSKVETVIHLSEKRGILLSISYKQKKVYVIEVKELDDSHILYDEKNKGTLLHYAAFAEEVGKVYKLLSGVIRQLSSEQAYRKTLIFTSYVKHNKNIELKLGFRYIHITFDSFDYVIEEGRIKKSSNIHSETSSEESVLLKKIGEVVMGIDSQTTYVEMSHEEFNERLDRSWNYFIEFFKSPKFIKKSEYLPK